MSCEVASEAMLHAVKPMIWQALQTLKDPKSSEDSVKRTSLKVLSHNLSADGTLPSLLNFDEFDEGTDRVDCTKYLDCFVQEALDTLKENNKEKEIKKCVARVHEVCWELCKVQITQANSGSFPPLLTETSTKIWWKIFNTFAEREADKTLYPVTMDWEEVDYWVNVLLKVMGMMPRPGKKKEKEIMGSSTLNFHEALQRFNERINLNDSMFVRDAKDKPDIVYIEKAMAEIHTRLFEGIYLSGALNKIKKNNASNKWCVLYQLGLGFADSVTEIDKSDPKQFFPITQDTEVAHLNDKHGRPVRFQLKNPKDSSPLVFETTNISVRNKWVTAIICMKHKGTPDYEKDSLERRRQRQKARDYEAEMKETLRMQKEQTQKQVASLKEAMTAEKCRFEAEAEQLRTATAEQLHEKIAEYEGKLQDLMVQMQQLSEAHDREKQTIVMQHESQTEDLRQQHVNAIGSVQTQLEEKIRSQEGRIAELEQQLADESRRLQQSQQESAAAQSRLQAEAEELRTECQELKSQCQQKDTECQELKSQCQQKDTECQELKSQCQQKETECQQKETECQQKEAECQELKSQYQQKETECQQNSIECQDLKSQCQQRQAECQELKLKCQEQEAECQKLKSQYKQKEAECQQKEAECQQKEAECQQKMAECQEKEAKCQQKNAECETLKTECQQNEIKCKETEEKLKDTEEKLKLAKSENQSIRNKYEKQSGEFKHTHRGEGDPNINLKAAQ